MMHAILFYDSIILLLQCIVDCCRSVATSTESPVPTNTEAPSETVSTNTCDWDRWGSWQHPSDICWTCGIEEWNWGYS